MENKAMTEKSFRYPYFVRGDVDGFIGLFIDNLVNLLLITGLCISIGMPRALVFGKILPATALSVLSGNIFYSYLARRLAKKEKRLDVTALPYGVNTVSLFAFFSLIIAPVYLQTKDPELAWRIGVLSCLISGLFEGIGAFFGEKFRRITPRAALLATLAGIAIVFIALEQSIKIWDKPLIAFIPLAFILVEYFSHAKLPFKIPAGFYALAIGSIIAWSMGDMNAEKLFESTRHVSFSFPAPVIVSMFSNITESEIFPYLSISIPMGLMSFFATIQNLESASAAGDDYPATPVLAMNGIGTIVGGIFGSPFPTTVYIGHPGWKGLGARTGYSIINGAVVTGICFTGIMSIIVATVPLEAGYPILVWIGVIITAQAFQTTKKEHAPAIALGLMPAIASWGLSFLRQYINKTGDYTPAEVNGFIVEKLFHLKGIIAFSEGALFSAMFLTAVTVYLIDRDFLKSFYWTLPLILFSIFGLIHSTDIGFLKAGTISLGYVLFAVTLLFVYFYDKFLRMGS